MEPRSIKKRRRGCARTKYPEGADVYLLNNYKQLMALIRAIDKDMYYLYKAIDRAAGGVDCFMSIYDRMESIEKSMDDVWTCSTNGLKVSSEFRKIRVQLAKRQNHHAIDTHRIYLGDPQWMPSKESICPLCGDILLRGPRNGEWYCTYCARLINEPVHVNQNQ